MIRKTRFEDKKDVYRLLCELENVQLDYACFSDIFDKQLDNSMYSSYVYVAEDKVVGFINGRIEAQLHHAAKVLEIMELIVDSNYRNNNIGRYLIDEIKKDAIDNHCVRIELSTSNHRKDAKRFYENYGFDPSHNNLTLDI